MSIHKMATKAGPRYRVKQRKPDGSQYSKTFRTRAQAQTFETTELNAKNAGTWIDNQRSSTTFGELAKQWLTQNPEKRIKSLERDKGILNRHILPTLKDHKLKSITKTDIQALVIKWIDLGLKPRTINRQVAVLKAIFQKAIDDDLLGRSPVRTIKIPKASPVEQHPLSQDEVERLLKAVDGFYRPFIYIAITTGLRWSELVGLQVDDINLLKQPATLKVERGLHQISKGFTIEKPKSNAGNREIVLSQEQVDLIAMHIRITNRTMVNNDETLFVSPNGHPINYSNFRSRVFRPACKKAGIDNIRIHDLRRTTATVLVGAQVDAKTIQVMMGHADIRTTFNMYVSPTPQGRKKASDAMQDFISGETETKTHRSN